MQNALTLVGVLLLSGSANPAHVTPATTPLRNVLLITVDDLRPQLNASYGMTETSTPNIDRLAADPGSTTFTHAYCQMAVCSPSRNSFMTGRRPETTRVLNFWDDFREAGPEWTTMPQYFKKNGYLTYGFGKLFHPDKPSQNNTAHNDFPRSWTQDAFNSFYWGNGNPIGDAGNCNSTKEQHTTVPPGIGAYGSTAACQNVDDAIALSDRDNKTVPQTEQGVEYDHRVATRALEALSHASGLGRNFFVAVGFRRPHLAWRTPRRFWDQYSDVADTLSLARTQTIGKNITDIAFETNGPMGQVYTKASPDGTVQKFQISPHGPPLPTTLQRSLRRGYYASVSFLDFEVGRLLDGLEKLALADSTAIIFHADHGWKLGEHGDWSKCSNWELDARVPLIVKAPWVQREHANTPAGGVGVTRSAALAELVDLYPTAVELAGLPRVPTSEGLEGASLVPALHAPGNATAGGAYAFSQYPRCPEYDLQTQGVLWECLNVHKTNISIMGYSVRSPTWRLTEWRRWQGQALRADWNPAGLVARELYSHAGNTGLGPASLDNFEYVNEAYEENAQGVVAQLAAVLKQQFDRTSRH